MSAPLITIVEDSPTQREMLRHMLEKNHYRVNEAVNGVEGLSHLRDSRPLAVITDIDMPEMNGYELCRRIKENPDLRDIPVILLTSLSDPENVILALECGADCFIMKPYSEAFLLSRIQHMLANTSLESEQTGQKELEVTFREKIYRINSNRPQILNLLISTYETAIQKNQDLAYATDALSALNELQEENMAELELKNRMLLSLNTELELQKAMAQEAKHYAEDANRAKSEFLSSMSHELRSPLNAILGFTQLMETDSPPPSTVQKESISQILQAGWHLLTLINEILDLAKIESRQTPLSNEPVSLGEVIFECQGMIEPLLQQRSIRMTLPVFAQPCFVMADRTRVKQVLINLLSNAVKYNSRQGSVRVECEGSGPERIRLSVSDSGAGLSPEKLAQLFQPFNRLGQECGEEEGTGIGLVVAKRLVELMGGILGVESTVGVGSVFWFELLLAEETLISAEDGSLIPVVRNDEACGTRLHTLLYIEDNPANLKLVEQIIARHPNIRLLTASDAISGIGIAREFLPDIVLTDINLSGISGIEAMKLLHSDPLTAQIPVIAVSANAMPIDIEEGLAEGFFRYITKPIKVTEFMEALNEALGHADLLAMAQAGNPSAFSAGEMP
jgi:signal transduction histidine kinase